MHPFRRTLGSRSQIYKISFEACYWESTLTFEEMATVLIQVEACLNSKPLSILPTTAADTPLTPGHFLIGEPIVTVSERNYE